MQKKDKQKLILSGAIILILLLFFSLFFLREKEEGNSFRDFDKIKESGKLTVLTLNSSTSYFIYREEPMGFHYDMIKAFCDSNNLELEVKLADNTEQLIKLLEEGEGDVIAYSIPVLNELKESLIYCGLSLVSHQVLVQRQKRQTLVKDVTELIGKKVTVQNGTKYYQRLENLNAELGGGIEIDTHIGDSLIVEDLIEMVSKGDIDYTLSDEYLAKVNRTYFRNINIAMPVSFDQKSSWAVSKDAKQLAKALDEWYAKNQKAAMYTSISKKYFELSKLPFSAEYGLKDIPKGNISPYDDLFKHHAKGTRFSWQLLAAISYQESHFINGGVSWAGATGIMGLMPNTVKAYGMSLDDRLNPDLSISVAVKLLTKLDNILMDIEDVDERTKFVLAAYNGGIGHIVDIRALANKYGANDKVWENNVRDWITQKRYPEYYNDPVCKNGYFRGTETQRYVDEVTRLTQRFTEETEHN